MLRVHFKKTYLLPAVFLIVISFLICGPAISEEAVHQPGHEKTVQAESEEAGTEGYHEADRTADLIDLGYRFLNFTLLVVILGFGIKKAKLMDYLSARSDEIRTRLDDLKKGKEEAEKKYQDIETRLKDFESKRRNILEEYKKEGIAEKDRIIRDARERANQIIAQSEATIKQELSSVRNRLKQEIVDLAIVQAGDIIRKEINEKDHDDLINEFITKVGRLN
jgi:F-type H+-transporting ATPase subunit b